MTTIVYKYGARAPIAGFEAFREQERRAHKYRRKLLDIEIAHHATLATIEREQQAEIAELLEELADADDRIALRLEQARQERVKQRKRGEQAAARAELKALKDARKDVKRRIKEARVRVRNAHEAASLEFEWRCAAGRAGVLDGRGKPALLPCTHGEWLAPMNAEERAKLRAKLKAATKIDPPTTGDVRREVLATMLQEQWPAHWIALQRADWDRSRARRRARADSGLYHGTYAAVEDAVDAAVKKRRKLGLPPEHHWVDQVRIGTQCQGGVTAQRFELADELELSAPGRAFQRAGGKPLPEHMRKRGTGRRSRTLRTMRVRVASDGRDPIWVTLPVQMQRPLPNGARVLWAYVIRRDLERAPYSTWEVQLTVDVDRKRPTAQRHEAVAVDVGWRRRPEGSIRVAYWVGSDGTEGTIDVPARIDAALSHSHEIRAVSDRLFDDVRSVVLENKASLPDAAQEMLRHAAQWKRHGKLVRVATVVSYYTDSDWEYWRKERKDARLHLMPTVDESREHAGEDWLAWYLYCWTRQDRHLHQWEADERRHALRSRDEIFRVAASRLAARYQTLVLEGTNSTKSGLLNLADLASKAASTEAETKADDAQRAQRVKAAPGECRSALVQAFRGSVEPEPLERTTTECHHCHGLCEWDAARELRHTCEHCGARWDQDANAAKNLLHRRRERLNGASNSGTARNAKKPRQNAGEAASDAAE